MRHISHRNQLAVMLLIIGLTACIPVVAPASTPPLPTKTRFVPSPTPETPADSTPIAPTASMGLRSIGPEGGNVATLAIDPGSPTTLYAGTQGGVFKTADGGESWRAVNSGLTVTQVSTLAIDPSTPATLYAGTQGGGVFTSTDGGETWRATNNGLTATYIYTLAIDQAKSATLYAGTESGVFKSTNGGETWDTANTGLADAYVGALAIDPVTPGTLYAGTWINGVFKSIDGGESWNAANMGLTTSQISAVSIDPSTPAVLYVGTQNGGVFKSTDSGANWSVVNSGLTSIFISSLVIDPATPTTLYVGTQGDGMFKSTDGGTAWNRVNMTDLAWIRKSIEDRPQSMFFQTIQTTKITPSKAPPSSLGSYAVILPDKAEFWFQLPDKTEWVWNRPLACTNHPYCSEYFWGIYFGTYIVQVDCTMDISKPAQTGSFEALLETCWVYDLDTMPPPAPSMSYTNGGLRISVTNPEAVEFLNKNPSQTILFKTYEPFDVIPTYK